jgi:hypothetical protein
MDFIPAKFLLQIFLIFVPYLQLFYIAITESLFVQIFTILIFYFVSWFIKQPTKNWYD